LGKLTDEERKERMLPFGVDAVIVAVYPDSPAEQSGLKVDDVILHLDHGKDRLHDHLTFEYLEWIRSKPPGTKITVTILRGNKTVTLDVILGIRLK